MTRMLIGGLLMALALAGAATAQDRPQKTAQAQPAVVNLNTATVAQLDALPGIGQRTAERIVEYRQKIGGFKKVEDLMQVRGVGEKGFLKLRPMVTVSAPKADRP